MAPYEAAAPQRKRRGQYAKTKATRIAILEAALLVFGESGFRSGSLKEVARRAGMTDAGLLRHYPTKVALLQAALDYRQSRDRVFVDLEADDPRESLRGVVALTAHNAALPGVVELYCTLSAEATNPHHPAHEHFVHRYEQVRASGVATFERLMEEGRMRTKVSPALAATMTIAVMDGLQLQWVLDRGSVDMVADLQAFFESIVDFGPDWSWDLPHTEEGEGRDT
nr:TetR/AcrR family transcriptional regulator [Rhodococcus wratislaviensis]GLK33581.1 TetR family transcriptional regulator [Rhodococcus wratislaviensis]